MGPRQLVGAAGSCGQLSGVAWRLVQPACARPRAAASSPKGQGAVAPLQGQDQRGGLHGDAIGGQLHGLGETPQAQSGGHPTQDLRPERRVFR